jgi:hypothetical protein
LHSDDPLIIFSGGLPRSSYSNKHSVSCVCENEHNTERTRHMTFDFTTEVIDFFTIDKLSNDGCMFIPTFFSKTEVLFDCFKLGMILNHW